MQVFAQFYTASEHEQFLLNLEREREIRLRLSELHRYRENGVTRHEECAHYEQVVMQNQGSTDSTDHWCDKKSVSIFVSLINSFSLPSQFIYFFFFLGLLFK